MSNQKKKPGAHSRDARLDNLAEQGENKDSKPKATASSEGADVENEAVDDTSETADDADSAATGDDEHASGAGEGTGAEKAPSGSSRAEAGPPKLKLPQVNAAPAAQTSAAANGVSDGQAPGGAGALRQAGTLASRDAEDDDLAEGSYDKLAGFDIDMAGYPLGGAAAQDGSYVAADFAGVPLRRKRVALKAFLITLAILVGLLLVAYVIGAVVFMGRFFPNTTIGDYDVSMKTDAEVVSMLDDAVASYQLDVVGGGFSYQTTGPDVGLSIDSDGVVRAMHEDLDSWRWPMLLMEDSHDESRHLVVSYKREDSKKDISEKVKKYNKSATAPVDASIFFDEETNKFEVKPEEEGTQLAVKAVQKAINEAIMNMQPHITLTDDHLKKPKLYSTDEKLIETAELASGMISAHVTMMLNGQNAGEVDGSELSKFVNIDDKFNVTFKEDEMREWVNNLTIGFDTIGTERHYTREDGKEITVRGGVYGWEIDSAATEDAILEAIKAGETTEIDIPCISTADVFSAPGERDWGSRYIDVDISEQHVRFYGGDGKIIWEADCISGSPDGKHDTWEGVWWVNNKESPSTLIGYTDTGKKEYETQVQYWMPFEGNGIGFHDATWQPGFGGSMYASGYGSHGCVNLSYADAERLFGIIEIGDVVVVHS